MDTLHFQSPIQGQGVSQLLFEQVLSTGGTKSILLTEFYRHLGYSRKPNPKERSKGDHEGDEGQYGPQAWALIICVGIWGTNASANLTVD